VSRFSIHFCEQYSGPFPFHHLGVSQITAGPSGRAGRDFSTSPLTPSCLPKTSSVPASTRPVRNSSLNCSISRSSPPVVGNVVGWSSYAISGSTRPSPIISRCFLPTHKRIRTRLSTPGLFATARVFSPNRNEDLRAGRNRRAHHGHAPGLLRSRPTAYDQVFYGKGAWIMHMLREMLRQPNTRIPTRVSWLC